MRHAHFPPSILFNFFSGGVGREGLSFYIGIPVVRDFDVDVAVVVLLLVAVVKVVVVVVSLFPLVFSWREIKHNLINYQIILLLVIDVSINHKEKHEELLLTLLYSEFQADE